MRFLRAVPDDAFVHGLVSGEERAALQADRAGSTPDGSTCAWLNLARALRSGRRDWRFESSCADRRTFLVRRRGPTR